MVVRMWRLSADLQLTAQIRAEETLLVHDGAASVTVPAPVVAKEKGGRASAYHRR